jgi:hypothetical protein
MKRSLIVMFLVLLGAVVCFAAPFANPFSGKWDALVRGANNAAMSFIISDTEITQILYTDGLAIYSTLGNYTFDTNTITLNGQTWLYYVQDDSHIGLLGWTENDQGMIPTLVVMKKTSEDIKSNLKPSVKQ